MIGSFHIFNKNSSAIIFLSKIFLYINVDDKIPTYGEFAIMADVARGTIQNSMKVLIAEKAIELNARGHLGTFLVSKDISKLIMLADIRHIRGAMTLPYSKISEGLATGLVSVYNNKYKLPISMSYTSSFSVRLKQLFEGYLDFTILSKSSAKNPVNYLYEYEIVIDFGPNTYTSSDVLVFSDPKKTEIEDGMRVGCIKGHVEQNNMLAKLCKNVNVDIIEMAYHQAKYAFNNKEIDVVLWNNNELYDAQLKSKAVNLDISEDDTTAVLVVNKNKPEINILLKQIIDVEKVKQIQRKVQSYEIDPRY